MVVGGETSQNGRIAIEHLWCSGGVLHGLGLKTLDFLVQMEEERLREKLQVEDGNHKH